MNNLNYIESTRKQLDYYKLLGEKTFSQLSDEQLFLKMNEQSNSVATIVKHLWGNMLSRWTDFLTSDGEKEWRKREEEFENDPCTRGELLEKWEQGWACLFEALKSLTDDDLSRIIYIRNQGHTLLEAVNRALCHYAYHVGQIVFIGKMLCGVHWESLSIPKGATSAYNQEMFAQPKSRQHFTDGSLGKRS